MSAPSTPAKPRSAPCPRCSTRAPWRPPRSGSRVSEWSGTRPWPAGPRCPPRRRNSLRSGRGMRRRRGRRSRRSGRSSEFAACPGSAARECRAPAHRCRADAPRTAVGRGSRLPPRPWTYRRPAAPGSRTAPAEAMMTMPPMSRPLISRAALRTQRWIDGRWRC